MSEIVHSAPLPVFLLFYAGLLGLAAFVCRRVVRNADNSDILPALPVSPPPDPYEVAYLRQGKQEIGRLAILELLEGGRLEAVERKRWFGSRQLALQASSSGTRRLPPFLEAIRDLFVEPRVCSAVYDKSLPDIRLLFPELDARLASLSLTSPPSAGRIAWAVWLVAAGVLLGLAVTRAVAEYPGFHAGDLVGHGLAVLGIVVAVTLVALTMACLPPRLSKRGEAHLRRLQTAYASLRARVPVSEGRPVGAGVWSSDSWGTSFGQEGATSRSSRLLAVALFGKKVLTGSGYDFIYTMFNAEPSSCG